MTDILRELGSNHLNFEFNQQLIELMRVSGVEILKSKIQDVQSRIQEDPELVKFLALFLACDRAVENRIELRGGIGIRETVAVIPFNRQEPCDLEFNMTNVRRTI